MKNLKKVLSLVLALAMALSLMTVAFAKDASDYADYSKVTYNEAVDVMTAIGVFDGMDGTNFAPDGTLTREQAAKIITYMLMGKANADQLTTTIAPYSDVSASRWSAGAIAYCTNAGILSGVGHGKFNPTDKLTGLQFAKMLLVALGYKADQEKLTGESWGINAATLGIAAGLNKGMENVALNGYLTREQAAQMAFNAEKATMVQYSNSTSVTTGDTTVNISGSRYDMANTTVNTIKADDKMQLAEKYCTELVLTNPQDAFGRPSTVWNYKGVKVGSYATTADKTYTTEVKLSDIKSVLPTNVDKVYYYMNGDGNAKANDTTTAVNENTITSTATAKIGGNGTATTLYFTYDSADKKYDVTIASVQTFASKVTSCEKNSDGKYNVELGNGDKYESDTAYAEKTVVLYTKTHDGKVQSMKAAEKSVTGDPTLVEVVSGKGESFTMNGTKYQYSATVGNNEGKGALTSYVKNVVAYLDDYGYVVYVDDATTVTNYAVVLAYNSAWGINGKTVEVQLLLSDGTVKKVEAKNENITWDDSANNLVTYTVGSDGIYTLNNATADVVNTVAVKVDKGVSAFTIGGTTYYANDKTVFFLYDNDSYKAVTGVANVPSLSGNVTSYTVKAASGNIAEAVYLISANNIETGTSAEKAAFLYKDAAKDSKYTTSDGVTYYTLKAVVDGKATTVDMDSNKYTNMTAGGNLVSSLSVDNNNRVTNYSVVTNTADQYDKTVTGTINAAAKDGIIQIKNSADRSVVNYTYASDVVCFVYDTSDATFTAKSITALKDNNANAATVTIQLKDGVITALYYVQD